MKGRDIPSNNKTQVASRHMATGKDKGQSHKTHQTEGEKPKW